MDLRRIKLTEEEWNDWSAKDKAGDKSWEQDFCAKYVDTSWAIGYGYYGVSLDYTNKMALGLAGSSCD